MPQAEKESNVTNNSKYRVRAFVTGIDDVGAYIMGDDAERPLALELKRQHRVWDEIDDSYLIGEFGAEEEAREFASELNVLFNLGVKKAPDEVANQTSPCDPKNPIDPETGLLASVRNRISNVLASLENHDHISIPRYLPSGECVLCAFRSYIEQFIDARKRLVAMRKMPAAPAIAIKERDQYRELYHQSTKERNEYKELYQKSQDDLAVVRAEFEDYKKSVLDGVLKFRDEFVRIMQFGPSDPMEDVGDIGISKADYKAQKCNRCKHPRFQHTDLHGNNVYCLEPNCNCPQFFEQPIVEVKKGDKDL